MRTSDHESVCSACHRPDILRWIYAILWPILYFDETVGWLCRPVAHYDRGRIAHVRRSPPYRKSAAGLIGGLDGVDGLIFTGDWTIAVWKTHAAHTDFGYLKLTKFSFFHVNSLHYLYGDTIRITWFNYTIYCYCLNWFLRNWWGVCFIFCLNVAMK